jgi:hypothetical protein
MPQTYEVGYSYKSQIPDGTKWVNHHTTTPASIASGIYAQPSAFCPATNIPVTYWEYCIRTRTWGVGNGPLPRAVTKL